MPEASLAALDHLLDRFDNDHGDGSDDLSEKIVMGFSHLRPDAGRASLQTLLKALAKLRLIRELTVPVTVMTAIPQKWLHKFRSRARVETIWDLRRRPRHIRYGLMAAFCFQRQYEMVDSLIDLLM